MITGRLRTFLFSTLLWIALPAIAIDYETIDVASDGEPLVIDNIRILGVLHLFTAEHAGLPMVELSALAWSEDEQLLYAVSDHGSVFHFRPGFKNQQLVAIELVAAFPLRDQQGDALGYPYSDSEGLYLAKGDNSIRGDDALLISFENRPRLQWHQADGSYLRAEPLPAALEERATYHRRGKALESVTIHPQHGVLTAPEYPLKNSDWSLLSLYSAAGDEFTTARDDEADFALCALESMPDGSLLALRRRHQFLAPAWTSRLERLVFTGNNTMQRQLVAELVIASGGFPVDNYEGLARHRDNRFFMISDNNEHFMQQTLLVYFEIIE